MVVVVVRRERLGSAGCEVRNHGVDGDAGAADENARLPSSAKVRLHPALFERAMNRKRRVLFAHRAVRPNRQQPLAAALATSARAQTARRPPHIDKPPSRTRRRPGNVGQAVEPRVHAAGEIHAFPQRPNQRLLPRRRQAAARIDDPNHQRPCAAFHRFPQGQFRHAEIGAAAGQPALADDIPRPPIDDALASLGSQRVLGIAEKDQIGRGDRRCLQGTA